MCPEKRKIDLTSSGTSNSTELCLRSDPHTKNSTSINSSEKYATTQKSRENKYAPFVSRGSCWRGRGGPLLPFIALLASSPDLLRILCCAHACCCPTLILLNFAGCPSTASPPFPIIVVQNCS